MQNIVKLTLGKGSCMYKKITEGITDKGEVQSKNGFGFRQVLNDWMKKIGKGLNPEQQSYYK